ERLSGKNIKSKKFKGLETRIRKLLERHFKTEFKNVRLASMINPRTGRPLEFDLYNDKLKLAIEVQGSHHRTASSYFFNKLEKGTREEQFEDVKRRDQMKLVMAHDMGIQLVIVHDSEITPDLLDDEVLGLVL